MTSAILVITALVAADPAPLQISVKVFYGTVDESQRADIEPWISKAAAQAGSPIAAPYTGWIVLTGDEQELYASMMGGRLIQGKVSVKDDKAEVEISGFKIGELKRSITLKSGERRVVKLTDYPVPNNVFIALAAEPPADESISVTVVGKLRAGIVAVGGETTGTTVTAKGVTWELDFGKNVDLRKTAERLDGKNVTVRGTLERLDGVEVKERWIVTVTDLQAVEGGGRK